MKSSKTKKKRIQSNNSKPTSLSKLMPSKVTDPYGKARISLTKKSAKSTIKSIQPTNRERMHTSNYQFPQFAIISKDNKKAQTIDQSGVGSCRGKPGVRDRINAKNKGKYREKISIIEKSMNQISFREKKQQRRENGKIEKEENRINTMQVEFREAVGKIFKLLDIFNKGKISEMNVNKWIPESALYFLGSIFQRIKIQRLNLTQQQFIEHCMPLLHSSIEQDIRSFISQTRTVSNLKYSLHMTDQTEKQEQISPIKKRMLEEELQRSNKKSQKSVKNDHLEDVMNCIKSRQAQLQDRLKQIKQRKKSVTFKQHALEQINPHQQPKRQEQNIVQQFSGQKKHLFQFYSPDKPVLKSILKNSTNGQLSSNQRNSAQKVKMSESELIESNPPVVANFTFQIPAHKPPSPPPQAHPPIEVKTVKSILQPKPQQLQDYFKVKLDRSQTYQKTQSYKILQRCKQNLQSDQKSKTHRRYIDNSDNQRLDRLQNKIEQYMKRNASKLQQSGIFLQTDNGKNMVL